MLRQEIDPLQSRSLLPAIVSIVGLIVAIALSGWPRSVAAEPSDVPAWLKSHVGEGEGQIAAVVLQRARSLYLQKLNEGAIKNPCYFAMDATRPAGLGRRFYVICEADRTFRAVPSGHGSGRNVAGANFTNGIQCAKNFSNAMDSKLTTGGPYMTAEIRTSFKGYYRSAGKYVAFSRSFVQFDGEGDTANARPRAIGGHPAAVLRVTCRRKAPESPYANEEGYVPVGKLQDYAAGRSNGCTSWSQSDAAKIIPMMQEKTTLYIYPESTDIAAIAQAVKAGKSPSRAGLYWNASCLRAIGAPKFWPKETLEPIFAKLAKDRPPPPPARPLPICKGQ
jgi:L,D-transpeptidase catalytic domain